MQYESHLRRIQDKHDVRLDTIISVPLNFLGARVKRKHNQSYIILQISFFH